MTRPFNKNIAQNLINDGVKVSDKTFYSLVYPKSLYSSKHDSTIQYLLKYNAASESVYHKARADREVANKKAIAAAKKRQEASASASLAIVNAASKFFGSLSNSMASGINGSLFFETNATSSYYMVSVKITDGYGTNTIGSWDIDQGSSGAISAFKGKQQYIHASIYNAGTYRYTATIGRFRGGGLFSREYLADTKSFSGTFTFNQSEERRIVLNEFGH